SGIAIAFCADDEKTYLRDIERTTRQKVPVRALPEDFMKAAEALKAQRIKTMGADPAPREDRPRGFRPAPKPRATHSPVKTADARRAGGNGGGGYGGGGQRSGGGGNRRGGSGGGGGGRGRTMAQG
ncbi:MAG TPA: ATP-dependent helicase, partial [Sphingomonas sp.]|nr:ATP-dependent helicase [Sphingomonas sp.]